MKNFKSLVCILMSILLVVSCFAFSASAEEEKNVTLHVTKYQIAQQNGEIDKIGSVNTLTGTTADAPTGATVLSGATFTIFKLGGLDTSVTDEQLVAIDESYNADNNSISFNGSTITGTSKTTDENGLADFTITPSEYGVYFVKETNAPAAVTAKTASFVVNLPMTDSKGYMYDVYVYPKNYTTLGAGILQLKDAADSQYLSGAKFAVYNSVDDSQITADYYGNSIGDSENHYLTTDKNGYVYVNNLVVGTYYFKEITAPDGYMLNGEKHSFTVESGKSTEVTVDASETLTFNGISLITATNSTSPSIKTYVTEVGKKSDSVSFGEVIRWYAVADVPADMSADNYTKYEVEIAMDKELNFYTDFTPEVLVSEDGSTYSSLDSSQYTVSAVADQKFTISFNNLNDLIGKKSIKVVYKTTLNESITTMDADIHATATLHYATAYVEDSVTDTTKPSVYTCGIKLKRVAGDKITVIPGAKYDLYTDYDIMCGRYTSDENGIIEIKGLTAGTYYLVETSVPEGNIIKTGQITFSVSKGSYNNDPVIISSDPAPKLPITGGMGAVIFTIVGLSLIALSLAFFTASKKARKAN